MKKFGLENDRHIRTYTAILNIKFSIGVCGCYQSILKASQLTQVKRIIKYINGINGIYEYEIMYSYDTSFIRVRYCDVN